MSISSVAIKRPIAVIMFFLAVILMGIVSLFYLPVELYPNVSFHNISIIIIIRGGIPPTEVESLVTKPIEEAISTVSHLKQLLSVSKEGEATIVLSFEPGTNMDFAALEVREKFARVKNKLPKEAEKPIIAQFKQTDTPIMILAVTSTKRTTESIRKIVDETIKERIKRISGVANVEVSGGRERKILVEIDKRKIYKNRLAIERVISILSANNIDLMSGDIEEGKNKYIIRTIGSFKTVDDIKNIAVATTPSGSVLRLKEIARVEDSYLEPKTYARMNIRPVVSLYVQKESTANTIKVSMDVEEGVERLRQIVPKDMRIIITGSRSRFIKTAINNLKISLFRGALLIIFILALFMGHIPSKGLPLLLFLIALFFVIAAPVFMLYPLFFIIIGIVIFKKDLRAILIVTLSIPMSLVITFGLMQLCNLTLPASVLNLTINFITMFGLALGVGMLVDNSVVVFENILRKSEEGLDRFDSALQGSTEMNRVIIASTLTTVIVFLPMVFLKSEMSLLYGGVAWTVTFSLIVSLFVALAIVPLMASRIKIATGKYAVLILAPLYKYQKKMLFWIMRRRRMVLSLVMLFFFATLFIYTKLGKEYMGTTEQNKFTVFVELPTGAKLDVSDKIIRRVEEYLKDIPEVKTYSSRVEAWSSKIYVELVGLKKRKRSMKEVIEGLRPKTDRLRPAFIYYEEEQEVGSKEIILDLFGYDYDTLRELAISMATRMNSVKGFTDTKIRMREGRPELGLKVDKQKAGMYDLSTRGIADSVHAQMRGLRATLFHSRSSEVETIARLDEKFRKTFKDVHKLVFIQEDGTRVFLDQVADFKYGLGPSEIWRKGRSRMIQVSSNVGTHSLSKAAMLVEEALKDIKFPESYYYKFGGDYPSLLRNQKEFQFLIWVILILIYLVLASIFESYYQPLIIMATVLFAAIGAIFSLYLTDTPIGMGALIGMMMLSGIVVNNGIILVDHINLLRKETKNIYRILVRVSQERLRPVLMTSVTTIIALVPMAFDLSEGSNLWRPLALTVIGGLVVATPLTLLLTSNIYLACEQVKRFAAERIVKKLIRR
ncbi:MAG: efflux RND transporter permease subunit [Candidatus Omnitrophica bacterium]|nr:efflux RND transporter permease subunit [Candidatus Omnitrophota bacterium]